MLDFLGLPEHTYNIIGITGSSILACSSLPQLFKLYGSKDSRTLSTTCQCMNIIGTILILCYGLGRNLWPTYTSSSISLTLAFIMLGMIRYYRHGKSVTADRPRDSATADTSGYVEVLHDGASDRTSQYGTPLLSRTSFMSTLTSSNRSLHVI